MKNWPSKWLSSELESWLFSFEGSFLSVGKRCSEISLISENNGNNCFSPSILFVFFFFTLSSLVKYTSVTDLFPSELTRENNNALFIEKKGDNWGLTK